MDLGKVIKTARKQAGLTQNELGKKLGVSGSMIGQWENNFRNPKDETIAKIHAALGKPFVDALAEEYKGTVLPKQLKFSEYFEQNKDSFDEATETLTLFHLGCMEEVPFDVAYQQEKKDRQERLLASYNQLNDEWQEEAVKRIGELAEIPSHRRTDPPEPLTPSTDTTPQEKPPEGPLDPKDGE